MGEAAYKLFGGWDVLTGELEGPGLEQGRRNDKRGPLAVEELPEGCLYVADLGFFGVQRLTQVAGRATGHRGQRKRFFVSRYQTKTALLTRSGHRINLRGVLPQQEGQRLEFGALLGAVGRLPARLRTPGAGPLAEIGRAHV